MTTRLTSSNLASNGCLGATSAARLLVPNLIASCRPSWFAVDDTPMAETVWADGTSASEGS
jgi:hypothetical protein